MHLIRMAFVAALCLLFATSAPAQTTPRVLADGMAAVAARDWDSVQNFATQADPVSRDILIWHLLRASEGTFAQTRAFLERRGNWPGLPLLRKRSEASIPPEARAQDVIDYFAPQPPGTGDGALRLAAALATSGQATAARAEIQRAYRSLAMTDEALVEMQATYAELIAPLHAARLVMLLDAGDTSAAQGLLALVSTSEAALARARIALQQDRGGIDAALAAVGTLGDPALATDLFLWRASKGRSDDAIALLETQSTSVQALGDPARWASWRRVYGRLLMRNDDPARAYVLASNHHLTHGAHYADLEFLSGFLALRKLGRARDALAHFQNLEAAVDTPISLGRAYYWQARAFAELGDSASATAAYQKAARHQTAFYGLLAAEALGQPLDPVLAGRETFANWRAASFTQNTAFKAGVLLLAADQRRLAVRFLTHLAESLPREGIGQLAAMAEDLGEPYLQVMLAKRGVQYGHLLERPYFPLHPMVQRDLGVAPELALAIARRESEFFPRATSGVGAQGMMQLMPATAEEVSGKLGLSFSRAKLLDDPDYNITLGAAYLAELQREFGASPVQIAAAYNAGPSRPRAWMDRFGDPRRGEVDVVDWIEHIPFRETRNYVMRVTESLPVYRARLSGQTPTGPLNFTRELIGAAVLWRPTLRPDVWPVIAAE